MDHGPAGWLGSCDGARRDAWQAEKLQISPMNLHPENQQAALRAAFTLVHELTRLSVTEPNVKPLSPSGSSRGPPRSPCLHSDRR